METKTGIERELPELVTEVATRVTLLPEGTAEGAVKMVVMPLAVLAGLNEPQGPTPLPVHVADHFTPLSEGSPVTTTAMGAEAPTWSAFGGCALVLKARPTLGAVMTIVVDAVLELSSTALAVTVTELLLPDGRAEGAV